MHNRHVFIFNTLKSSIKLINKKQVTFELSNIQVYFSERFILKWSSVKSYQNRCLLKQKCSFYSQYMYRCNGCLTWQLHIHKHTTLKEITEVCQVDDSGASIWQMFISCVAHQAIVGMY